MINIITIQVTNGVKQFHIIVQSQIYIKFFICIEIRVKFMLKMICDWMSSEKVWSTGSAPPLNSKRNGIYILWLYSSRSDIISVTYTIWDFIKWLSNKPCTSFCSQWYSHRRRRRHRSPCRSGWRRRSTWPDTWPSSGNKGLCLCKQRLVLWCHL